MKILLLGSGGREHALAWKAAQSSLADQVFVAPGNAGTAREQGITNVPIAADDVAALVAFAQKNAIGLTIVGPEAPLVLGVVDAFRAQNLPCFGPTQGRRRNRVGGLIHNRFRDDRHCLSLLVLLPCDMPRRWRYTLAQT